jgi:phenylacetate-CoA ligase
MGIIFRIKDFGYPFSILKLRGIFEKNQWLAEAFINEYQSVQLRKLIAHAYTYVPYYQKLFRANNIVPDDIQTSADLEKIPFMTKELLQCNFDSLTALDSKKYRPALLSTSGTTGGKVNFYVDKPSNVLEFVYYWRFWGWAGYRLGDIFADLDVEFFPFFKKDTGALSHFNYFTKKLTVNSLLISLKYADELIRIFKKFKPLFLKGIPSNLYMLALVLHEKQNHSISFRAIFSQGENLLAYQRELVEKVFSCRIFDSYGQMERTVAISQCQYGTYHLHPDYGIAEFADPEFPLADDDVGETCVKEIVGTSLHNLSMPLIRYRTRDMVKIRNGRQKCACNRGFPAVISVLGRDADVIITPDRRAVTALYLVFDHTPGVVMGQIVQEKIDQLLVKIVFASKDTAGAEKILKRNIQDFIGTAMKIKIEQTTIERIKKENPGKFKVIVSNIQHKAIFE